MFVKHCIGLIVLLIIHFLLTQHNNVCEHFSGYYYPDFSSGCSYKKIATLTSSKIIREFVNHSEIHHVVSEDNYRTTLFRIPRNNSKGVVLLHHSIATDSKLFLWQGNTSFAFQLWQQGYDVWLANHRGTVYSTADHRKSFWNFSFHEIGKYDVSAELSYIHEIVNEKVTYIGHSLGATTGLIYASLKPEESNRFVKKYVLIATPYNLKHTKSLVIKIPGLLSIFKIPIELWGYGPAVFGLDLIRSYSHFIIRLCPFVLQISNLLVQLLLGWNPNELDPQFFNYYTALTFDNHPLKMLVHFLQIAKSGEFQMYDYGQQENSLIYGQSKPPLYPIRNINVPLLLISSPIDDLISAQDSDTLFDMLPPLPNGEKHEHWLLQGLNHLDYFVGKNRNEKFTNRLLKYLDSMNSS